MIIDFTKYKIKEKYAVPPKLLVYPGLPVHVEQYEATVEIYVVGSVKDYFQTVALVSIEEADKLMNDLDKFLQYKSHELPEYNL